MLASATRAASTRRLASRARHFATVTDTSGFKIIAADNGQSTTSVSFVVKAGSRYEPKPGLAHVLRNFGFKNTTQRSALGTIREAELYGGVLSSSMSREHVTYTADFLREDEEYFVEVLSNILTSTRFTRYELEESVLPYVEAEATEARADPATYAIELAHAIAFRSGLGAPLFSPPHSHITIEDVTQYAKNAFGRENVTILGSGISQEKLSKLVTKHLSSAPNVGVTGPQTTKYHGGETRVTFSEHGQHAPHTIFIGYGIPGQPSAELSILNSYLSTTPSLKWSTSSSPLATGLPSETSAKPVLLQYSDAALFGVIVQGKTPEGVTEAGKTVAQVLKNLSVKEEDFKRATAKAKFSAASEQDSRSGHLVAATAPWVNQLFSSTEKLTSASVGKLASDLRKAKPTFVAVGDIYRLPHLDQLGL
ncbi:hypothetical protein Clacol_003305 [Clathrus columnatus]|uniref:Cytochrome b-c1 complex subunit 2, mitochondrial n=1 Tax=Clathrus columnatus TaxID=1419009 RepID=A0AAV5A787_9AGAM|nr:hypothetical protein Clacol_003305 [Clathrus columnatus]